MSTDKPLLLESEVKLLLYDALKDHFPAEGSAMIVASCCAEPIRRKLESWLRGWSFGAPAMTSAIDRAEKWYLARPYGYQMAITSLAALLTEVEREARQSSIIEALPLAKIDGTAAREGWIISPDFLLEVKGHLEGDFADGIDLEEIECVLFALNKLQAKYRLGEAERRKAGETQ